VTQTRLAIAIETCQRRVGRLQVIASSDEPELIDRINFCTIGIWISA
jgi:hypothetical protein